MSSEYHTSLQMVYKNQFLHTFGIEVFQNYTF